MITPTLRSLIKKDIYLFRKPIYFYIISGLIAFFILKSPGEASGYLGSILCLTLVAAFYCHLVLSSVVFERNDKNQLFIMTLPITARSSLISKLISCSVMYVLYWSFMLTLILSAVFSNQYFPSIYISYFVMILSFYMSGFLFLLCVSIATNSAGWSVIALVVSNVIITSLVSITRVNEEIKNYFIGHTIEDVGVLWPSYISEFIGAAIICGILCILATGIIIYRKKNFL